MIFAENLLVILDGPPIERLGLVILALGMKQKGEVVIIPSNVGMILAENLFVDHDGPTMERLGLHVSCLAAASRRGRSEYKPRASRSAPRPTYRPRRSRALRPHRPSL